MPGMLLISASVFTAVWLKPSSEDVGKSSITRCVKNFRMNLQGVSKKFWPHQPPSCRHRPELATGQDRSDYKNALSWRPRLVAFWFILVTKSGLAAVAIASRTVIGRDGQKLKSKSFLKVQRSFRSSPLSPSCDKASWLMEIVLVGESNSLATSAVMIFSNRSQW